MKLWCNWPYGMLLIYLWFLVYPIILFYAVAIQRSTQNTKQNAMNIMKQRKCQTMELYCAISHHIAVEIMMKKASEAAQLFRFRLHCSKRNMLMLLCIKYHYELFGEFRSVAEFPHFHIICRLWRKKVEHYHRQFHLITSVPICVESFFFLLLFF